MEALFIIWLVCGLIALLISLGQGRSYLVLGFGLVSFMLGPIALLIALNNASKP